LDGLDFVTAILKENIAVCGKVLGFCRIFPMRWLSFNCCFQLPPRRTAIYTPVNNCDQLDNPL